MGCVYYLSSNTKAPTTDKPANCCQGKVFISLSPRKNSIVKIANEFGLAIETCAEAADLDSLGINHAKCIDRELIEEITKYRIINKDKLDANREFCRCMKCMI